MGALAGVVLGAFATAALAEPAREPLRLVYKSEGLCPSGERFFSEVRARTDKIRPAHGDEPARTLRVEVEEGAKDSGGTLVVVGADGTASSTRTVRAKTCGDVASALALVAALAIDPEARTSPTVPPPTSASAAPDLVDASAPTGDAAVPAVLPNDASATATTTRVDAEAPSSPTASPRAPSPPPPEVPARYRGYASFGAEGSSLLEMRPAFAIEVGLDVLRGGVLSPAIGLRASRSFTGEERTASGTASMTFSTIAIEPCPLRLEIARDLAVLPCARVAFGFVEAEGSGITTPLSATRGWGDVGTHAKLVWNVGGPVRLSGHGGARFPLFRDRFFVDPDVTLYEAPAAVFAFGGDLGIVFP